MIKSCLLPACDGGAIFLEPCIRLGDRRGDQSPYPAKNLDSYILWVQIRIKILRPHGEYGLWKEGVKHLEFHHFHQLQHICNSVKAEERKGKGGGETW